MTYVSFPGLGIEPFQLSRIAFSIGNIDVNWYGVIITCGMILAVLYALRHAKIERVKSDDVIDLALALIICGVIGARLYYVVMKWSEYVVTDGTFWENLWDTLYNVVAVWNGGLAIYGGIIGGFIAGLVVARVKHIRFPVVADIAGPSVIIGQIIGRFGNFVNVEAYGGTTTLPWRMCSPKIASELLRDGQIDSTAYQQILDGTLGVHPTFLYESLWNLVGFVLITLLYKKKKFHGQMFLFYITWYGFGRMLIEGLRTDSLYIGPLRVSQIVGLVTFIVGTVLLILGARRAKANPIKEADAAVASEAEAVPAALENADEDKENAESETAENEIAEKNSEKESSEEVTDGKVY